MSTATILLELGSVALTKVYTDHMQKKKQSSLLKRGIYHWYNPVCWQIDNLGLTLSENISLCYDQYEID